MTVKIDVAFDDAAWVFALPADGQLAFVKVQCYMKLNGRAGRCRALSPIVAARRFAIGEENFVKFLQAARSAAWLLDIDGDWVIPSWRDDQGGEDSAAVYERVKRSRARRSGDTNDTSVSRRNTASNETIRNDTTASIPRHPIGTRDSLEERDTNKSKREAHPGSKERLIAYALTIGVSEFHASMCFDHYEMNGWVQGNGRPIRDWKAAVRQWKSRLGVFATAKGPAGGDEVEFRKVPKAGLDYWMRVLDGVGRSFKIIDGVKTDEPFSEKAWKEERGLG